MTPDKQPNASSHNSKTNSRNHTNMMMVVCVDELLFGQVKLGLHQALMRNNKLRFPSCMLHVSSFSTVFPSDLPETEMNKHLSVKLNDKR